MRTIRCQLLAAFVAAIASVAHGQQPQKSAAGNASNGNELNRIILPIPKPERPAYTELDVRNTQPPPRFEATAPSGAPNVVIVLIDDLGCGAITTFGGSIPTPTFDRQELVSAHGEVDRLSPIP